MSMALSHHNATSRTRSGSNHRQHGSSSSSSAWPSKTQIGPAYTYSGVRPRTSPVHSSPSKSRPMSPFRGGMPPGVAGSPNRLRMPQSGGNAPPNSARTAVEEEYIRNLQQQVYLLELETRYMRNNNRAGGDESLGGGGGMSGNPPESVRQGTLPLNDAIKGLKYKYVELQENHKKELKKMQDKIDELKTENHLQGLNLQTFEKERDELKDDLRSIRDHHATEKDKLYGELIATRKKAEVTASEYQRLEKTHNRVLAEKHQLQMAAQHSEDDAKKFREQVDELLHVNATMKVRIEELHKEVVVMQARVEDYEGHSLHHDIEAQKTRLEDFRRENVQLTVDAQQAETRAKQEETLRIRISQDCDELVKANVTLKAELEEVQRRLRREFEAREQKIQKKHDRIREAEETREELSKIRDELAIQKIAMDNKDRRLSDYKSQVMSMENALNLALETRNVLEERVSELEARARTQEQEIIQVGQDKSLLTDDVAELRNTSEIKAMRLQQLMKENQDLKVQLDKFSREMAARREFANLIGEIEQSGENYMYLMRNMRSYLHRPMDPSSTSSEVEDIISDGVPVHHERDRH